MVNIHMTEIFDEIYDVMTYVVFHPYSVFFELSDLGLALILLMIFIAVAANQNRR